MFFCAHIGIYQCQKQYLSIYINIYLYICVYVYIYIYNIYSSWLHACRVGNRVLFQDTTGKHLLSNSRFFLPASANDLCYERVVGWKMLLVLSWFSHVLPASLLNSYTGWAVEMPSLLLSRLLRRCVQCRRTSRLNWFLKSEPQRPITPLLCFFVRTFGSTHVKNNI